ncbi:MAG TPA: glutamate synthase subunit alpha, partial [Sneathiellales bacterium]|nr:glutamate synthase subunit alpha [Sneathiellales bacterium]
MTTYGLPSRQGMYDPRNEHDSCGIGFVVNIKGRKSHQIITQGIEILVNLTHRGAVGADPMAGDGAGLLIQVPDDFFRAECAQQGIKLPVLDEYGVGVIFLPQDPDHRAKCEIITEQVVIDEGQQVLGWRDVPVDSSCLGESVKSTEPVIRQIFVGRGEDCPDVDAFERKLFVLRK